LPAKKLVETPQGDAGSKKQINKMKKLLAGFTALAAVLIVLPMFAAFEAHVINVTAKIENALLVPVEPIRFGTVFPQEQLDRFLPISLSSSFMAETDADDVNYIIRQKPKCGVTSNDGTVLVGPTWTGHVVTSEGVGGWTYEINCETDKPKNLPTGAQYGLFPSLCQYLSKHETTVDQLSNGEGGLLLPDNDGSLAAFHQPFTISATGTVVWNDVKGRLARSENDTADNWKIDLKVPCFGGYCAQDWATFVAANDGNNNADPNLYTQPIGNEHKVFGCNLWVEVTGVSRLSGQNSGTSL
jgi:hypothetical protein